MPVPNELDVRFSRAANAAAAACWACDAQGGWTVLRTPRGDDTPDTYGPDWVECPVCGGTRTTTLLRYEGENN